METIVTNPAQLQWAITIDDSAMVNSIKRALLMMKGVVSVKDVAPKSAMTEREYYAMLDHSIMQARQGKTIAMKDGESVSQFLARVACTE
ncbi:MAG: hypothetical protein MJZ65_01400 [Paludibacteraceae bacterium]|nr:hypothetical protein [Paludibacteraceae bacterium]